MGTHIIQENNNNILSLARLEKVGLFFIDIIISLGYIWFYNGKSKRTYEVSEASSLIFAKKVSRLERTRNPLSPFFLACNLLILYADITFSKVVFPLDFSAKID